MSDWLIVII